MLDFITRIGDFWYKAVSSSERSQWQTVYNSVKPALRKHILPPISAALHSETYSFAIGSSLSYHMLKTPHAGRDLYDLCVTNRSKHNVAVACGVLGIDLLVLECIHRDGNALRDNRLPNYTEKGVHIDVVPVVGARTPAPEGQDNNRLYPKGECGGNLR